MEQPRERAVQCSVCQRQTWNSSALCAECEQHEERIGNAETDRWDAFLADHRVEFIDFGEPA